MSEPPEPETCANCAAVLQGPYCHACGQKGRPARSLTLLLEESLGSVAHLDNRLLRTLPLLLLKPGRLSREWARGRHAPYVSPLAVFLFSVFVLFAVVAVTGRHVVDPEDAQVFAALASKYVGVESEIVRNLDLYARRIEETAARLALVGAPMMLGVVALVFAFRRGYSLYDHAVVSLYGLSAFVLILASVIAVPGASEPLRRWMLAALVVHAFFHLKGAYGLSWIGAGLRTLLLGMLVMIGIFGFLFLVSVAAVMS